MKPYFADIDIDLGVVLHNFYRLVEQTKNRSCYYIVKKVGSIDINSRHRDKS